MKRWQIDSKIDEMDPLEAIFSLYLHNLSLIVLKDMELINKDWNGLSESEQRYLTLRIKQYSPKELAKLVEKVGQEKEKKSMDFADAPRTNFVDLIMRRTREREDAAPPTSSAGAPADENF